MAMSRKELVRRWMRKHELSYADFAERLGISQGNAYNILNNDTIPAARRDALLALGVPEKLLPGITQKRKRRKKTAVFPCDKPDWKGPKCHAILTEKSA